MGEMIPFGWGNQENGGCHFTEYETHIYSQSNPEPSQVAIMSVIRAHAIPPSSN